MIFNKVKKLAEQRKMSLNQVEEAIGYPKNSLYHLKKKTPSADRLKDLADYFNVTTDYLLGREELDIQTMFIINNAGLTEEETEELRNKLEDFQRMLLNDIKMRKQKDGR